MVEEKSRKQKPTVRERTKQGDYAKRTRRLKVPTHKVSGAIGRAVKIGGRRYQPFNLPEGRTGRILNRPINLLPKYFQESWAEIRQTTWPTRRETVRLTLAVFVFSVIFTSIVASLDFGLDKLFREIIVK